MALMNTPTTYGSVTRFLHWLLALFVIVMLTIGLLLDTFHSPLITNIHKMTGLAVLALAFLSIIWNLMNKKLAYPASMPTWQRIIAKSVQHTMLLCAFLMPITGWIFSSAAGKPPKIGHLMLAMPYIPANPHLISFFKSFHTYIAYFLIGLISVHMLAALFHHFVLKDGILKRMWTTRHD